MSISGKALRLLNEYLIDNRPMEVLMCPACLTTATWIIAGTAGATSAGWLLPLFVRKVRETRREPSGSKEESS